jgi:glyoxylase-like metal-dependent hydrolase (beta-lactamase superfamily II)
MRKNALIIFFLILNIGVSAQVFKNDELSITKLQDDMWVVETIDNTTMYIIEGSEKALLVDTGTKCTALDEVVKKITQKPLYIVITHIHVDHAGNMNYFDDVYFNKSDTVLLDRLNKPYEGNIHYVEDGDVFDLGNKTIEVKHMPGHTPGSIVLIDKESGNCFSGDAFGSGQVWLQLKPFTPIAEYARSCQKMLAIMEQGITKIYCGHYPCVKKAFGTDYMLIMENLALKIEKGEEPEPKSYPIKISGIGTENPMITSLGTASIVYDPEIFKQLKKVN